MGAKQFSEVMAAALSLPNETDFAERRNYWDDFARHFERWTMASGYYRKRLAEIYSLMAPPGMRVLELGCGRGDLLAALKPSYGLGLDISDVMNAKARERHPSLHFETANAQTFDTGETYDYIICSDLFNDLWDVEGTLRNILRHCHASTRLILNCHSRLWEKPRRLGEMLGLVKPQLTQNWLTVEDLANLIYLADMEIIRAAPEIMCPFGIPFLATICNEYLVKLWPFRHLGITNFIVARPAPRVFKKPHTVVTVVVPARNEAGNIARILDRVPEMGLGTDLIFVEGHSSDNTFQRIREEIDSRPGCGARLYRQTGKGKGDAVRLGFAQAKGEVLMILDADLTVAPEDLPRFYDVWRSGKGDFVNGVRLVYPMHENAMRFLNLLGNKFFTLVFTWLLSQNIKDTLCGTKVVGTSDYKIILENRAYFGDFDPFGDFDLIFGAARYNLKIVDMPIRYNERTYGTTNIKRWSQGWLLLKMVMVASRRIRFI